MSPEVTYLPFAAAEAPVSKIIPIGTTRYVYELRHNRTFDFYTLTIKDEQENVLYVGKLTLDGNYLCAAVHAELGIGLQLIPEDRTGAQSARCEAANFGDAVTLNEVEA